MWIHFYGGNSRAYYEAYLSHNNNLPIGTFPIRSKAVDIFASLLEFDSNSPQQIIQCYKIADYLTQLISECVLSTMSEGTDSDVPQIIQSVRMFLQNDYVGKHSLEDLGAQFNIHPHYLQKQFKRYVGMSPLEYQIFVRLTKAKELLRDTKKSVGEIAIAVGIDNQGYFTRLFKSQEGMAPLAYRKLWPGLEDVSTERFVPFSRDTINRE